MSQNNVKVYTLRSPDAIHDVTFTYNIDGTVTVDEDSIPVTMSPDDARPIWKQYVAGGYKFPENCVAVKATPAPAPIIVPQNGDILNRSATLALPSDQLGRDVVQTLNRPTLAGLLTDGSSFERKACDMERTINDFRTGGGLVVLNTYIPVELSTNQKIKNDDGTTTETGIRIPCPAGDFAPFAIHLDGSHWLMRKCDFENQPAVRRFLALMVKYKDFIGKARKRPAAWPSGVRDEEFAAYIARADACFVDFIREIAYSLTECINNADAALAKHKADPAWLTMDARARVLRESKRDNAVRAKIKDAEKELAKSIECAMKWDNNEYVRDLFAAVRGAIRAERMVFNARAEMRGVKKA